MPKEIKYVQCDCKKGKLEEIAETKVSFGFACGDGGDQTIFYACNKCKKIYERAREISGNYMGDDPDIYSDYLKYRGELTIGEIIEHAQKHFGDIYGWDEKKIIDNREDFSI